MRIGTNKKRTTFDGFLKEDFERLGNLCKQVRCLARCRSQSELTRWGLQYYNISIETKDISVRGWNWGVAEVQGEFRALPFLARCCNAQSFLRTCGRVSGGQKRQADKTPTGALPPHSRRPRLPRRGQAGLHHAAAPRPEHVHHEGRGRPRVWLGAPSPLPPTAPRTPSRASGGSRPSRTK